MTQDYTTEAQAVADALNAVYENKQTNKKNSISGDYSTDNVSYPTVKAVKNEFGTRVTSWSSTTSDTNYPSEKLVKTELDNKIDKSQTTGLVKNDGTIDTTTYLSSLPSHTHGNISNDGKIGTTSGLPVITTTGGAVTVGEFGTSSGQFAEGNHTHSQYLTSHQSLSDVGGVVTVEKQSTPETGYAHTYVIKQGSSSSQSQVGVKINIPKDFLVKSGEVKTVASADLTTLGEGYSVGDKYIDFVVNTKGNDGTDEHIYINVKDLVEDTTYSADGSTLQLSSTTFSIKNKGVTATQIADNTITASQIASKTITASEIADSVVAKNITQTDINNWNSAGSSNLTTSDVQGEISAFATALANAINPPTS